MGQPEAAGDSESNGEWSDDDSPTLKGKVQQEGGEQDPRYILSLPQLKELNTHIES
jgi:hypothetical protein